MRHRRKSRVSWNPGLHCCKETAVPPESSSPAGIPAWRRGAELSSDREGQLLSAAHFIEHLLNSLLQHRRYFFVSDFFICLI